MENLGKITAFGLLVVAGLLVSLLQAYVAVDLLNLYQSGIPVSVGTVFVLAGAFQLLTWKEQIEDKTKTKKSFNSQMEKGIGSLVSKCLLTLFVWGVFIVAWYWWFK